MMARAKTENVFITKSIARMTDFVYVGLGLFYAQSIFTHAHWQLLGFVKMSPQLQIPPQ
jgi:hypothetical protein